MGDIKLDSVSYFNDVAVASRGEEGNTIMLSYHESGRDTTFAVDDWPEIQAVVNAAIAGFEKAQEEGKSDE